jgi:hypothetical protein
MTNSQSSSAVFPMSPRNGSKLSGQVTLAHAEGPAGEAAVSVSIKLDGVFIPEAAYPAGIYGGSCTDSVTHAPKWKLNEVKTGESTTVLFGQTLQSLEASLYCVSVQSETSPTEVICCGVLTPR